LPAASSHSGGVRSTRLQLSAASLNWVKRRTLPRVGAVLKRAAVLVSRAATWRASVGLLARPKSTIARVEAGPAGTDTRFIVTNLEAGRAKHPTSGSTAPRGQAENHIKGLEESPRGRSHRRGQPVSPVPACRCLLALVVGAPCHAQRLGLAHPAVRHLTAAADQACRPRCRAEDSAQNPPAVERTRSSSICRASSLERRGIGPELARFPLNLQRLPDHRNKPATVGLDRSVHALRSQPFRVDYYNPQEM
jgi:hypothetical protein